MRRTTDLSKYENVLPYASEIFGVYQPKGVVRASHEDQALGAASAEHSPELQVPRVASASFEDEIKELRKPIGGSDPFVEMK